MKFKTEYADPVISKKIASEIRKISKKQVRLMEVCGTHTTSIFKHGIRTVLPDNISLISGPGCPVCVTSQKQMDYIIELSKQENVIIVTFGDLIKVPGTKSSLQKEKAKGRNIKIAASPLEALEIAKTNPDKNVVFPGIGFETTAPTIAGTIIAADSMNIKNFFVYSAHKTVPAALFALMNKKNTAIDGFILPGHVSMVIGTEAYIPFWKKYKIPCTVAGFEAADILYAILSIVKGIESQNPELKNLYERAVDFEGNKKALSIMEKVFKTEDANWRGIGNIAGSGLRIRKEFTGFDAEKKFCIKKIKTKEPAGCSCGDILTGVKIPPRCGLYKTKCTPENPVGPCMVSTEGTCAAYCRYNPAT